MWYGGACYGKKNIEFIKVYNFVSSLQVLAIDLAAQELAARVRSNALEEREQRAAMRLDPLSSWMG